MGVSANIRYQVRESGGARGGGGLSSVWNGGLGSNLLLRQYNSGGAVQNMASELKTSVYLQSIKALSGKRSLAAMGVSANVRYQVRDLWGRKGQYLSVQI